LPHQSQLTELNWYNYDRGKEPSCGKPRRTPLQFGNDASIGRQGAPGGEDS